MMRCARLTTAQMLWGLFFTRRAFAISHPEKAGEIIFDLPPFVTPVGVFVNASEREIDVAVKLAGLRAIQLHGDEPPEACLGHAVPVIRVIRVGRDFDVQIMGSYLVNTFLLDTEKAGFYGGTGETFDWTKAVEAKAYGRIILAGGLNPDNIREAIERVGPYSVDTSSGVEAEPGKKDHKKVKDFLARAKA